jgi:Arc/MetJ-type ribon-helix-helix transcriptional regulator
MTVELTEETGRLLREQLQSGQFKSVDDLLASALAELATRNSKLNRQRLALQESAGAWKDQDHPELASGSAAWVRGIRAESHDRIERIERHRQAE